MEYYQLTVSTLNAPKIAGTPVFPTPGYIELETGTGTGYIELETATSTGLVELQ